MKKLAISIVVEIVASKQANTTTVIPASSKVFLQNRHYFLTHDDMSCNATAEPS
jgi:hypothetical protein